MLDQKTGGMLTLLRMVALLVQPLRLTHAAMPARTWRGRRIPNRHRGSIPARSLRAPTSVKTATTAASSTFAADPMDFVDENRVDLLIKAVYARYYIRFGNVPTCVKEMYLSHIKAWGSGQFTEKCDSLHNPTMSTHGDDCVPKRSAADFLAAFHRTIDSIATHGFNSSITRIPAIRKEGRIFALNGAHRIAAAIATNRTVTMELVQRPHKPGVAWPFFVCRGLSCEHAMDAAREWIAFDPAAALVVIHPRAVAYGQATRDAMAILKKCSISGILFQRDVHFTQRGYGNLLRHLYGFEEWMTFPDKHVPTYQAKATQQSESELSRVPARFVVIRLANLRDAVDCKLRIRNHYAERIHFKPFKASVHIGDTHEQHLMLANMVFNQNSIRLMNYARGLDECRGISSLLARSLRAASVRTPASAEGMVNLPDSIIVDSGAAMAIWGLRKRTDIDVVGLWNEFDANAVRPAAQVHHFAPQLGRGRPWGKEHLRANTTALDLVFNQQNFGWCHGVKVMGLEQLEYYKTRRGEKGKDDQDVALIRSQLKMISGTAGTAQLAESTCSASCRP